MSDKLVRDEILRSHRYQSLSTDTAKLLFLHLLLSSDNLSNAEATTTSIGIVMGRPFLDEALATLLSEMADRDLVRIYVEDGKRYVHIPRSRQRIRYLSGKHPRPPRNVEDKEISELIAKVGLKSDRGQSQVGPFSPEEKRSEEKKPKETPHRQNVDKSVDKWWSTLDLITQKAKSLGLTPAPGESKDSLYRRIRANLNEAKEKTR